MADEEKRWCYACGEVKPLTPKYWSWANKEHTRFRTKCRACTNFDSKISHRLHYEERKQNYGDLLKENKKQKEIIDKLSKIIFEIKDSIEITGGYPSNYIDDLLKILEDEEGYDEK